MAINIFSGGSKPSSTKTPRVSSAAERAAATTAALPSRSDAVASNSGATAVKSGGILGKIGNFVGKAAGVLKYMPGPVGNVASIVSNLIPHSNDPEWWQTIPGDGLSTNAPLMDIKMGADSGVDLINERPAILEFLSDEGAGSTVRCMRISERMCTQYIMPAVRKVSNAITLQKATDYITVLEGQATMYALWRQLKKLDYFIKHGTTFMPNLNDVAFPLFQVANAAWLQSTITRLEEYLHANVRLPHTLCEYLTWRFGKTFRTSMSAKAGFVFYNVAGITWSIAEIENLIKAIMTTLSSTEALQKAVADLYNAYLDHDQEVLIAESTLCFYDAKEFVLRTNLDLLGDSDNDPWAKVTDNCIIMDSNLDNPTVFMASTVSATHGGGLPLFPVYYAHVYLHPKDMTSATAGSFYAKEGSTYYQSSIGNYAACRGSTTWAYCVISPYFGGENVNSMLAAVNMATAAKAVDFYNVGIFIGSRYLNGSTEKKKLVDLTSISIDAGSVPDIVIENEQVMAFANLVTEVHKNAETYKAVERRAAKDVANFVENNDIAAMSK